MATASLTAGRPTTPGEIRYFPEAATQTFKRGEFVYLINGKVTACTADPVGIAGMAEMDATGTTNTAIAVTLAKRGQQFTLNANSTTAVTNVGTMYGYTVTSNIPYVDVGDTTNKRLIVDAIAPDDAVGDTYGHLIVEVCKGYAQLDMTTS